TSISRLRKGHIVATGQIGQLPETVAAIEIGTGDLLELRLGDAFARSGRRGTDGTVKTPAMISVDVPAMFARVNVGDRVVIDDGLVEGIGRRVTAERIVVEIVRPSKAKLRAEKGINLPDTQLQIGALTPDDLADLAVVAPLADMIALSYVGTARD